MSKERGLLNLCAVAFKARNICPFLLTEISELLAQPEQDNIQYLLDQVARLTAENAMLKEKWSASKPEQEPVAWIYEWVDEVGEPVKSVAYNFYDDANPIPLYTAPPKREPLSTDAMLRLIAEHRDFPLNLVRAVEKAHGIGGEE